MTIVEFLEQRIAEAEAAAEIMRENARFRAECNEPHNSSIRLRNGWTLDADRVLAECQAKRAIVELHEEFRFERNDGRPYVTCDCQSEDGISEGPCDTKRILALPDADHPDYQEEWRP